MCIIGWLAFNMLVGVIFGLEVRISKEIRNGLFTKTKAETHLLYKILNHFSKAVFLPLELTIDLFIDSYELENKRLKK